MPMMTKHFPDSQPYQLPDGRIVQIAADVARGALLVSFELRRGHVVYARRCEPCADCGATPASQLLPPIVPAPHVDGCECDVCMPPCPDCGSKYTEQQQDGTWICLPCTDTTDVRAAFMAAGGITPENTN